MNKDRAEKMIGQGLMTESGMARIEEARNNGEWETATLREDPNCVPSDVRKALEKNQQAKTNFDNMAPSYQKHYIWWIIEAKRKETRARRIAETVKRAEQNKKPGVN